MQWKEGSTLLLLRMKACETQGQSSYRQYVLACKHVYTNKSIMIAFAERLPTSVPIWVAKNMCKIH